MGALKWLLLISLVIFCPSLGLLLGPIALLFDMIKEESNEARRKKTGWC